MREIATLALLARNDKGIPQGIAALVSLARNDKGIPHEIAALVALARNDWGITLAMTGRESVEFSAVA